MNSIKNLSYKIEKLKKEEDSLYEMIKLNHKDYTKDQILLEIKNYLIKNKIN
jgi:hypothetical protein